MHFGVSDKEVGTFVAFANNMANRRVPQLLKD